MSINKGFRLLFFLYFYCVFLCNFVLRFNENQNMNHRRKTITAELNAGTSCKVGDRTKRVEILVIMVLLDFYI